VVILEDNRSSRETQTSLSTATLPSYSWGIPRCSQAREIFNSFNKLWVCPGVPLNRVRIIAIMLRSQKVAFECHLRCQEKLHISKGVINIYTNHFGFPYGTADIMCSLPSGCETPSHVALTSTVKNQKEVTDSFPYNFTVCFSTMYNFTNILQLVQSLEMLQLLGVNRVVIYKTNCSVDTQRVLDYYTNKGLVEVIPWSLSNYLNVSRRAYPHQSPADLHYFGQISALNDFLYRYMYQSRYVALHDVDELILPQKKKLGADKCYRFQNNWFPSEFTLPPPKPETLPPQDQWQNVSGMNFLAHLYREPVLSSNCKTIVSPRAVFSITVHGVLSSKKGCASIDRNIARMYHISRTPKHKQEEMIYDGRLLSFSAHLIPAVSNQLREAGLLPADNTI
uniref:Glycosyltransferase family 92 protein n=1 Tax=Kryptolebias marmoratus TaxID=37003 RepID=A0A3Q2ZTY3_KRYMA